MATTSTVPVVMPALKKVIEDKLPGDVRAFDAWPGNESIPEMVIFGAYEWEMYEIPTYKAGRKQRQEEWTVIFELVVFDTTGHTEPDDAKPSRDRAFELFQALEDVVADDPDIDLADVQRIELRPDEAQFHTYDRGWAFSISGTFRVWARLK